MVLQPCVKKVANRSKMINLDLDRFFTDFIIELSFLTLCVLDVLFLGLPITQIVRLDGS